MDTITFTNADFGDIRAFQRDDAVWFFGIDIASKLGYSNTQKAIRDHVDDEDKLTERFVLSGQNRRAVIVNESGMYSLVLSSKLPTAKKFKRWVTSEVLPAIRKTGKYHESQPQIYQLKNTRKDFRELPSHLRVCLRMYDYSAREETGCMKAIMRMTTPENYAAIMALTKEYANCHRIVENNKEWFMKGTGCNERTFNLYAEYQREENQ